MKLPARKMIWNNRTIPQRLRSILQSLLIAAGLLISYAAYYVYMDGQIYRESMSNLSATYGQINRTFNLFVQYNWNLLSDWKFFLEENPEQSKESMQKWFSIDKEQEIWMYTDLVLYNENDDFLTLLGRMGHADNCDELFGKLYQSRKALAGSYVSSSGVRRIMFAIPCDPVSVDGVTYTAIGVTYDNTMLEEMLTSNAYGGGSDCFVINADGEIILSLTPKTEIKDAVSNLSDYLEEEHVFSDERKLERFRDNLELSGSGGFAVHYNDKEYYIYQMPVGMQDWSLVAVVQTEKVDGAVRNVQRMTTVILSFLCIGLLICLLWILGSRSRAQLQNAHLRLRNMENSKHLTEQLLSGITKMVDRFAICDLEKGTYEYREMKGNPLYPETGDYKELVESVSGRYTAMTGDDLAKITNMLSPEHLAELLTDREDSFTFEYSARDRSMFMLMNVIPLAFKDGTLHTVLLASQDIGVRHELENLANTDALTGLFNKRYFESLLNVKDQKKAPYTLFYMDLNLFKPINDQYGHAMGDKVLVEVARRLLLCIRSSDHAFRLGGDEFAVIVGSSLTDELCRERMQRMRTEITRPMQIDGHILQVGVSCGAAVCPADADNSEQICELADRRMYEEKEKAHERMKARYMEELR